MISLCRQPQLRVFPHLKFSPKTSFCFPQSHWQSHILCDLPFSALRFGASQMTISLPNLFPVRSINLPILSSERLIYSPFIIWISFARQNNFHIFVARLTPGMYDSSCVLVHLHQKPPFSMIDASSGTDRTINVNLHSVGRLLSNSGGPSWNRTKTKPL